MAFCFIEEITELLESKVALIPKDATWDSELLGQPSLDGENMRECYLACMFQTIKKEGADFLLEFAEV